MLDTALGKAFTHLATLILVALVFALPVHVVQAYLSREVYAVQEIGPEIRAFPEGRQVRGVAASDFDRERNWLLFCFGIDLLFAPLAYRAARRVIEIDDRGGVPGVVDAWTHVRSVGSPRPAPGPVLVALSIGLLSSWFVWKIGGVLGDMASADSAWVVVGLTRALAVSLVVGLTTGVAAATGSKRPAARATEKLDLY
jgi:hypothetical protein